ncbi:hypothetical protein ACLEPN_00270 [Myxococcus sp. 1LA]
MLLETHLTVDLRAGTKPELRDWATHRNVKVLCIELARGVAPRQVMLTQHGACSVEASRQRAETLAQEVHDTCGARTCRIKVEARWPLPLHRREVVPPLYLEHHVRVATRDLESLERLAAANAAHLSRNAYKSFPDGLQERFLTQRFGPRDDARMAARFDALLAALASEGLPVTKVERECVLFDDNLSLDEGWLEEIPR